jgi:hypothetical protein
MKSDPNHPQSLVPRRRWLGGMAAALGGVLGLATGRRASAEVSAALAPSRATTSPARPPLAVRPAPDAVKRHG